MIDLKIQRCYTPILKVVSLALLLSGNAQGGAPRVEGGRLILDYGNIIEVGTAISTAIAFLEGSNYRCSLPNENPNQTIFCELTYDEDHSLAEIYKIDLIIENEKIVDFDIRQSYLLDK